MFVYGCILLFLLSSAIVNRDMCNVLLQNLRGGNYLVQLNSVLFGWRQEIWSFVVLAENKQTQSSLNHVIKGTATDRRLNRIWCGITGKGENGIIGLRHTTRCHVTITLGNAKRPQLSCRVHAFVCDVTTQYRVWYICSQEEANMCLFSLSLFLSESDWWTTSLIICFLVSYFVII